MTIERIPLTDDRASWLELRKRDITASDVAIVCGEGLWGSTAELFAEKKGLRPPRADTDFLLRGRILEPSVFEALALERPTWSISRAKIYLRDPKLRLGATPDGMAVVSDFDGPGIVQAKTVARTVFQQWLINPEDTIEDGAIKPPNAYLLQTLTEMILAEAKWGALAMLIMKGEFACPVLRTYFVERNPAVEAFILQRIAAFWRDYLDANIMPEFNPQRDANLLKALYPEDDGSEIDLSTDNRVARLVEDLTERKAAIKRLKDEEKEIQTELKGKMAEHTYARLADGRYLSWKQQHRRAYLVDASDTRKFSILNRKPKQKEEKAA